MIQGARIAGVATIGNIIQEANIPPSIYEAKLKHGEHAFNKDLAYELMMQIPEVGTEAITKAFNQSVTSQTFYRSDVYFSLPQCKGRDDIASELNILNSIAPSKQGPYCPQCQSTNTVLIHQITRSLDEEIPTIIKCHDCGVKTHKPKIVFPKKPHQQQ